MIHDIEKHYRDHLNAYLKVAYRFLKDHGHAEDAVQEAYAKALKHWHKTEEVVDFDGWMYVVFQNTMRTMRQKILNNGVVMEVEPQKFPVDVFAHTKMSLDDLDQLIEVELRSDNHKRAIRMWIIKGYTVEEIEDLAGISTYVTYAAWKRFKGKIKEA